jgi:hypothetical protein
MQRRRGKSYAAAGPAAVKVRYSGGAGFFRGERSFPTVEDKDGEGKHGGTRVIDNFVAASARMIDGIGRTCVRRLEARNPPGALDHFPIKIY